MRTASLAGGIAVVRSGVAYVEHGNEVLDIVLWRLGYRPERVEQKKNFQKSYTKEFCEFNFHMWPTADTFFNILNFLKSSHTEVFSGL